MKGWNIGLPHDENRPEHRYVMPDPDVQSDLFESAYRGHYHEKRKLTDQEIAALLSQAGGYRALTRNSIGQEACVQKLRDLWRARRALKRK